MVTDRRTRILAALGIVALVAGCAAPQSTSNPGEAEDTAKVVSVDEHVEVPFGTNDDVLKTEDFTPLDPDVVEHKFYARGVGPVQVIAVAGGSSREELISFVSDGPP